MRPLHAVTLIFTAAVAAPPAGERIAFASNRDGNWEIYVSDADGRNQTRLTRNAAAQERFPMWSPDNSRIAFGSLTGEQWEHWALRVMNADGTGAKTLATGIVAKNNRQWSRDGKRILFSARVDGDVEVFSVEVASGRLERLTRSPGDDVNPEWSPDEKEIAFSSVRDGNPEIYVMRADGSQARRLTSNAEYDGSPAWSPDGTRIAFTAVRGGAKDVYLMRLGDGRVERLTTGGGATNDALRWSADGAHIAFQSTERGNYDVQVVRVADRQRRTVAGSAKYDGQFAWSPSGDEIVFISARDDVEGVYVADLSGRTRRLTTTQALNPAWSR